MIIIQIVIVVTECRSEICRWLWFLRWINIGRTFIFFWFCLNKIKHIIQNYRWGFLSRMIYLFIFFFCESLQTQMCAHIYQTFRTIKLRICCNKWRNINISYFKLYMRTTNKWTTTTHSMFICASLDLKIQFRKLDNYIFSPSLFYFVNDLILHL